MFWIIYAPQCSTTVIMCLYVVVYTARDCNICVNNQMFADVSILGVICIMYIVHV